MRVHATVLALCGLIMLAHAQAASAAPALSAPFTTHCEKNRPDNCFTRQSSDVLSYYSYGPMGGKSGYLNTGPGTYTWMPSHDCWYSYPSLSVWKLYGSPSSLRICVLVGVDMLSYAYDQYLYPDIPEADRPHFRPVRKLGVGEYYVDGHLIDRVVSVTVNTSAMDPDRYCHFYTARDSNLYAIASGTVALDRTPNSIMSACGFLIRQSQYVPPVVDDGPPEDDARPDVDGVEIPGNARPCGPVDNGSERVTVRTSRHSCMEARRVLRTYSRSLRSPRGWSCSASMNDARFTARCARRQSGRRAAARAAVYGTWVRR